MAKVDGRGVYLDFMFIQHGALSKSRVLRGIGLFHDGGRHSIS